MFIMQVLCLFFHSLRGEWNCFVHGKQSQECVFFLFNNTPFPRVAACLRKEKKMKKRSKKKKTPQEISALCLVNINHGIMDACLFFTLPLPHSPSSVVLCVFALLILNGLPMLSMYVVSSCIKNWLMYDEILLEGSSLLQGPLFIINADERNIFSCFFTFPC